MICCTLTYSHGTNGPDGPDGGVDPDILPASGTVTVTPTLRDRRPILTPTMGITPRPFEGVVDVDGVLRDKRGGADGMRVWANDPDLGLQELWYRIDFDLYSPIGERLDVASGFVQAPATDVEVNLLEELQTTGSGSPGITRGPTGSEGPPGDWTQAELEQVVEDTIGAFDFGTVIHSATIKSTPVANDEFVIADSAASYARKRVLFSAIVTAVVAAVVDGSPSTLDTLNELAAALGDDPNFATTITNALAMKAPSASPTFTGTVSGITKAMVGLGNVDNTSDATRNLLTANRQTNSYTLVLSDAGKAVEMNSASANNCTVPLNATVAFPTGTVIEVDQYGAGQTTIVATGGVTIRSRNGLKLAGQYAGASLRKIGTDEWWLIGDTTT